MRVIVVKNACLQGLGREGAGQARRGEHRRSCVECGAVADAVTEPSGGNEDETEGEYVGGFQLVHSPEVTVVSRSGAWATTGSSSVGVIA